MRRHVGASIGAMDGSSIEAGGTDGTVIPLQLLRRCLCTNGSIQVIAIPRQNSNGTFTVKITVTNRVTLSCNSTIGSRQCKVRPRWLTRDRREHRRREALGNKMPSVSPHRRRTRKMLQSPHNPHSRRNGKAKKFRAQVQRKASLNKEARQSRTRDCRRSNTPRRVNK